MHAARTGMPSWQLVALVVLSVVYGVTITLRMLDMEGWGKENATNKEDAFAQFLARRYSSLASATQETKEPPMMPAPLTDEEIQAQCLRVKIKSSRPKLDWSKCSIPFEDDDRTVHPQVPKEVDLSRVVYIPVPSGFGQLCNRLGTFAAMFFRLGLRRQTHALALGKRLSQAAWALDRQTLSQAMKNGILLDCKKCDKKERFVRCSELLYDGVLYNVKDRTFRVSMKLDGRFLFNKSRPRHHGYMSWLADFVQPKAGLKRIVENIIQRFTKEAKEKGANTVVGIHRRTMDYHCYQWFGADFALHCYGHSFHMDQVIYNREFVSQYPQLGDHLQFHNVTDPWRAAMEKRIPFTLTCNYTLEPHQIETISQTWPLWNKKGPFAFIIADDGQAPAGRIAFENSAAVKHFGSISDYEDPECFANKKDHFMLADMYAMTISELHMGMVISSCDDTVAVWRRALKKSRDTSFPTECYNGYYYEDEDTIVK